MDWWFSIIDYALHGILPDNPKKATSVRWRSTRFYYDTVVKILYRCSCDGIFLRYLSNSEAQEVFKEAHNGICGAHQPGLKLKNRQHWLSYYWPTMISDAIEYVKRYKPYQIHEDFMHQVPDLLHPTVASWSFKAWGINVAGRIDLLSAKGHQFIFVITDYFSK